MLEELLKELERVKINIKKIDHYEEMVKDFSNLKIENRGLEIERDNLRKQNVFLTEELIKVQKSGMLTCLQCEGHGGIEDGQGGGEECDLCTGTGVITLEIFRKIQEKKKEVLKEEYFICPECGEKKLETERHLEYKHCSSCITVEYLPW